MTRPSKKRLRKYAAEYGYFDGFGADLLEGLLHEVCHSVCFGIEWGEDAVYQVTTRFEELNGKSPLLGLVHEAQCLATERAASLKLGWKIDMADIELVAWEGSKADLSLEGLRKLVKEFGKEGENENRALEVVAILKRL